MKPFLSAALIAAFLTPIAAPVIAGPIDRACMLSPRDQKSWTLCRCIQRAANDTLSRSDQRRAAKFFRDPQLAQDTRQSDNPASERFWLRYKAFGSTAAAICT
ncbi:MAG: hypothetical protein JXR13_10630 [Thalassovita sp.]